MAKRELVWLDGELIPAQRACVPLTAHALHYGTAAFEGIRFYASSERFIFRLRDHAKRLLYSARSLGMRPPYSLRKIENAIMQTLQANPFPAGYIRPILFYGRSGLGVGTSRVPVQMAVLVLPWGKYLKKEAVSVKVAHVRRLSPATVDSAAKIAGSYVNSVVAHEEARRAGFDEALLLSCDGDVAEGSGENIFIVKGNKLYTPRLRGILPGITRETIMALAAHAGYKTREETITLEDVYKSDECFFTGTAAEVTAVRRVGRRKIGGGRIGPVTKRLAALYQDAVHGRLTRFRRWLTAV